MSISNFSTLVTIRMRLEKKNCTYGVTLMSLEKMEKKNFKFGYIGKRIEKLRI